MVARWVASEASVRARVASPTPALPGPIKNPVNRGSFNKASKSVGAAKGMTMMLVSAVAYIGSAICGTAMVINPAPHASGRVRRHACGACHRITTGNQGVSARVFVVALL